ncbi:MAG: hypothetical protein IK140_05915 [Clostridia bacterium]|nr:hypothetical protein [Clostridia bacterium]
MKRLLLICMMLTLMLAGTGFADTQKPDGRHAETSCLMKSGQDAYEIGDVVSFGSYEQDNNAENGTEPIEWIVLDVQADGSLVLISRYALDAMPYHESYSGVSWETCMLRRWLNEDFFDAAFSAEEQAKIKTVTLVNEGNPGYRSKGGNDTDDKVWLLSINEATGRSGEGKDYSCFMLDSVRICYPTAYAEIQGAFALYDGGCFWWLRNPGRAYWYAAFVDDAGCVYKAGSFVVGDFGVRPVICVLP